MNTEAKVRAANSPQEALIAIAVALDALLNAEPPPVSAWADWADNQTDVPPADRSTQWLGVAQELAKDSDKAAEIIESDDGTTDIVIPSPSDELKTQRRQFEQQNLKLAKHLGDSEDWNEAYAKGGPMWLYIGNRELVMSYPAHVRAAMVQDVEAASPQDAQEMARDVLKQACEDGPGSVAMRANDGIVNVP